MPKGPLLAFFDRVFQVIFCSSVPEYIQVGSYSRFISFNQELATLAFSLESFVFHSALK
jgi:hypothetical protein